MVVAGAANVRVIGQQLALPCRPRRGAAIEAVLEDRLDRAVRAGADVEAALAGRFQAVGPVMARQAQNADRGAVSLLRMWPALQDQRNELGGVRTDCRRVGADALDRPLGIAPVGAWHVLGDCRVAATAAG